jgi:hypothetical protein
MGPGTGRRFMRTDGLDGQIIGVGNFSGIPGETDLLLRNRRTGGPVITPRFLVVSPIPIGPRPTKSPGFSPNSDSLLSPFGQGAGVP